MKNVIKDTASLNAEEIITNKIVLDGNDISYSMLPKLVHRTTLQPHIEGEEVVDKQYYTLHNDAGQCVYVSPSLSEYMYSRWWRRRWWWGGGGGSGWYFLPIVLPAHPGGKGKRRPRPKKTYVDDISWYYFGDLSNKVPNLRDRNWLPSLVKRAVAAWEISNLEKFGLQFSKVQDCTRMFYGCKNLKGFYSTNFQKCTHATGMFEECSKLTKFSSSSSVFKRVQYGARMFSKVGLREIDLNVPDMIIANSMFENCEFLQRARIRMGKCQMMSNMFKYCTRLAEVRFPKDDMQSTINYLGAATNADGAFWNTAIADFKILQMGNLKIADSMFRDCKNFYQIETMYPKLESANHMFRNCKDLRYFLVDANSDENLAKFPKLISARYMFRDCQKFQPIDFKDDSFPVLEDGMCMFDNVYLTNKIPCKFPALKNARQMFRNCNFTGAFDLDMPTYFPNVSVNDYPNGDYPTAYMFGYCPITSISFDVSTCDHCISMFSNCKQLRQCTKAVFKEGSVCQSMFTESMFDIPSARIIIAAAVAANVASLHIGMDVQYRTEEFRNEFGFTQLSEGSDDQWQHPSANIVIRWNQQ